MAKKDVNEKKQSKNYFKEMKAELKKVVWPTPKELFNNTVAVVGFVLIIGIIVFVLDFCFDNANKYGVVKFQEKIQSTLKPTENNENTEENATEDSADGEETENAENSDIQTDNSENAVEAQVETENNESTETTESNE